MSQADLDLIREALDALYSAAFVDPHEQHRLDAPRDDAVAALSRLERLLQEQEEALRRAVILLDGGNLSVADGDALFRYMEQFRVQPGSGKTG